MIGVPNRMIPGDQGARDAIATDLSATLFVEAGAGSGKTTQMVARILELLLSGRARIQEVAAITFTEAAAAELRDRIAEQLELVASFGPDPVRQAAAVESLAGLDAAAITTLHGFSRRILADHPFAAGLPPVFEVFDEVRSMVSFDERWGQVVDGLLADTDAAVAFQWALACGVSLDNLRSIARTFDANWDLVPEKPATSLEMPAIDPRAVLDPLRDALSLGASCADPEDRLLGHLLGLVPLVSRLEDGAETGTVTTLRVLAGLTTKLTAGSWGKPAAWGDGKAEVHALLRQAQDAREEIVDTAVGAALTRLGAALGALTLQAAAGRRREGRLEFHDLLVLARDLVRDDPEVQAALHDQYRFLLIDEFQDTDPIQAELAVRIAAAGSTRDQWRSLTLEPGRLFFVGDPKQSIYRFRRADIELFLATKSMLADQALQLTTNFRSVPGIVAWVDAVFGELIGEGESGLQASYSPSGPAREAHRKGLLPVTVLGLELPPAASAPEARALEAKDVAAAVLAARSEGWPIGEEGRPARLADVTVLVPTRLSVPALQEALDAAAVPYRLESSSLVYAAPEVQDLVAILHAVDDPTDDASVVAALRSPGFGCGDDDLLAFRAAGGQWDFRLDPPPAVPPADPVATGLRALRVLHSERWWHEVSTLVAKVVEDRRLLPLALDGPRWREAWRRLRFMVDQARQFTESSPGDLRRFLAWVDLQQADDARVTEVVLPESDVDAVRIMTIHAAKGLEFPIVVLAGIGSERRGALRTPVLFGPDGPELGVRKGRATAGFAPLAERERLLEAHEDIRLLYVAATRARDHLVVSVHRSEKAGSSMAGRLVEIGTGSLWRPFGAAPDRNEGSAPRTDLVPSGTEEERAAWLEQRSRRLGEAPRTLAATGVAKLRARDAPEDETEEPPIEDQLDRPAWRRGRAGTAVGRAVHAALQSVDLENGRGLEELARVHAKAEGIEGRAREVAALVRAALDSEVIRSAVAGGRYWRELYVGAPVSDRVLEGFIDLLIDGPEGLEVVDYKTDQGLGLDDLPDHYRLQGAAYAVAVEAVLGRTVGRCTFLFLRSGGAESRRIADLEDAKAEVRSLMASS